MFEFCLKLKVQFEGKEIESRFLMIQELIPIVGVFFGYVESVCLGEEEFDEIIPINTL